MKCQNAGETGELPEGEGRNHGGSTGGYTTIGQAVVWNMKENHFPPRILCPIQCDFCAEEIKTFSRYTVFLRFDC